MKFESLFDFKYFVKGVQENITDGDLALRIKNSSDNTIEDKDYFLLTDSVDSYISELKMYSKGKTFYKKVQNEKLDDSGIVPLLSCLTHLSIGLADRRKVRDNVDVSGYLELKNKIMSMVDSILLDGELDNTLLDLLK
jgi:hypothetical protein